MAEALQIPQLETEATNAPGDATTQAAAHNSFWADTWRGLPPATWSSCLPASSGRAGSTERKRWAQSGRTLLSRPDPALNWNRPQHSAEYCWGSLFQFSLCLPCRARSAPAQVLLHCLTQQVLDHRKET